MSVKEFRFSGVSKVGQPVQGTVFAKNPRLAKKKVQTLAEKHGFRMQDVLQRRAFLYKVKHPNGKVVNGEQKAFSAEEISAALTNLGVEVVKVQKKLLDYQSKPPQGDMIMFVRLAANLLTEKLPFNADLKGGMEAQQAFMKHQHMLGKFTAYMLGIASKSGNMAEIYEATARFLERQDEFRKSIKSAMTTPALTIAVLTAVFIWYIWWIFPETAGLFEGFNIELPPMTRATLDFSRWLDGNWMWVGGILLGIVVAVVVFVRSARGQFLIDQYLIRLPVIGSLLHKLNIEIFCRVFAVLYSGSGDNISVIKVAAEACGNSYMEHRIKTITVPMMVAQGAELVRAMEASQVFTPMALARFRSGAETGNVRNAARQMADYYENETTMKLRSTVEMIQTLVAVFITIAIMVLTLISSEIAMIQPSSTDFM